MANIINGVRPQRPTDAMSEEIWLLAEECWSQDVVDRPVIVDAYNRLAVVGLFWMISCPNVKVRNIYITFSRVVYSFFDLNYTRPDTALRHVF